MKLHRLLLSLCSLLCLLSLGTTKADESIDSLIQQAAVFDQNLQAAEALACYLPAEKADPNNVTIARQYRHLMADASDPEEKIRLGKLGHGYALRAVSLAPNEAETHLSVAISHAKMSPLLDNKEKMEASSQIKTFVDRSIALDPTKDLAWHVLGCWHQRLADLGVVKRTLARIVYGKLPEASNEEAVQCFKKAIELDPNRLIHHIELGRTYAQMGMVPEAKEYLKKGLSMPNTGKDDPEMKKRGLETLAGLE
jgi:tetratricopeptide (TPR) repeat protein